LDHIAAGEPGPAPKSVAVDVGAGSRSAVLEPDDAAFVATDRCVALLHKRMIELRDAARVAADQVGLPGLRQLRTKLSFAQPTRFPRRQLDGHEVPDCVGDPVDLPRYDDSVVRRGTTVENRRSRCCRGEMPAVRPSFE